MVEGVEDGVVGERVVVVERVGDSAVEVEVEVAIEVGFGGFEFESELEVEDDAEDAGDVVEPEADLRRSLSRT
jgi:hypothetical protein